MTGHSHFMLIFILRKVTSPNRINSIPWVNVDTPVSYHELTQLVSENLPVIRMKVTSRSWQSALIHGTGWCVGVYLKGLGHEMDFGTKLRWMDRSKPKEGSRQVFEFFCFCCSVLQTFDYSWLDVQILRWHILPLISLKLPEISQTPTASHSTYLYLWAMKLHM